MPSYRQNKPEADILMNSMRSMGYTFESAIADILSKTLAIRLLEDGKRISTGVGRKLGTYITGYAHQYLAEKSIRNTHKQALTARSILPVIDISLPYAL